MKSALTNGKTAWRDVHFKKNVVLPAPFGPANTTRTGFLSDPDVRNLRRPGTIIERHDPESG